MGRLTPKSAHIPGTLQSIRAAVTIAQRVHRVPVCNQILHGHSTWPLQDLQLRARSLGDCLPSGSRQKKMLPSPVLAGREHDEPVILRGATHIRRGPSRDGALFRPFLARGTSRGRLRPRSGAVLPPVLSADRFQRSAAALSVRWTGILCRRHGGAAIFSYYRPLSTEKSMGML